MACNKSFAAGPDSRARAIIEAVTPEVDGGRFPIKRTVGETVNVEATIFADGHDKLGVVLQYRHTSHPTWLEVPMTSIGEGLDRFQASFTITEVGEYVYTIAAWIDHFTTWRDGLEKKFKAGVPIDIELLAGALLIEAAATRAEGQEAEELKATAQTLRPEMPIPNAAKFAVATSPRLAELMWVHADRPFVTCYEPELRVVAERELARFGAWYELFPRAASPEPGRHGTFADVAARLPEIAAMGFDIVYLPPIHPIGRTYRKGPNNRLNAGPEDPGSPWAIGSEEGGHKAVHPQLGTLEDFRQLVQTARQHKLEIALDIAFQCAPDHPYVREHPEWFKIRPDGTIQYAENPPKKYQDIYPFNFETDQWELLWAELKSVFDFWIEQGVKIFRVDNPHTKSLRFWAWCIGALKTEHPDLIFLSEAFTRRPVMYHLAKIGFTQSYNYFPWRNTKTELTKYLTELSHSSVREYFRANLWPNTPDILTQYLQYGGRPAFMIRFILAATLGASYGIYGPPFELCLGEAREPGSEEYLNSEKYQIHHWDLAASATFRGLIRNVNRIRRENPAFHGIGDLRFHKIDNEQIIAYSKTSPDRENVILTVVNLDPRHTQSGWIELPLADWGLQVHDTFQVHDLLTGERFLWSGRMNYLELNPRFVPAHIFRVRRFVRTEQDFDYFM